MFIYLSICVDTQSLKCIYLRVCLNSQQLSKQSKSCSTSQSQSHQGSSKPKTCQICGKGGHLRWECKKSQDRFSANAAVCDSQVEDTNIVKGYQGQCPADNSRSKSEDDVVEWLGLAASQNIFSSSRSKLDIKPGKVNSFPVEVMRDSGCTARFY